MDASISILGMHAAYIDLRRRVVAYKVVHLPELVLEAVRVIGLLDVVVAFWKSNRMRSPILFLCVQRFTPL